MNTELIELRANVAMVRELLEGLERRIDALQPPQVQVSAYTHPRTALWSIPPVIHPECITHDVPPGYDTVLGFLAKSHPDVLECFDYTDPRATQRDGYWLAHRCREQGIPPTYVDAPPVLQERDIVQVRAYPIDLLEQRWGA